MYRLRGAAVASLVTLLSLLPTVHPTLWLGRYRKTTFVIMYSMRDVQCGTGWCPPPRRGCPGLPTTASTPSTPGWTASLPPTPTPSRSSTSAGRTRAGSCAWPGSDHGGSRVRLRFRWPPRLTTTHYSELRGTFCHPRLRDLHGARILDCHETTRHHS